MNNGSVKSHKALQGGETINEYEQVICANVFPSTFQFIAFSMMIFGIFTSLIFISIIFTETRFDSVQQVQVIKTIISPLSITKAMNKDREWIANSLAQ